LALIALAVMPLLVFGAVETWTRYHAALSESTGLQREIAVRVAEHFKEYIVGELESDMRVAARVSGVEKLDPSAQRTALSKLLTYKDAFAELALLDGTGREMARVSRTDLVTESDLVSRSAADSYLVPTATGETYYSPIYSRTSDAASMLDIAVPLVDRRTGAVAAILVASVRLQPIWDAVAYAATGSEVTTFVVDEFSRVVAHPNASIVLRGETFRVPSAAGVHAGLSGEREVMAFAMATLGDRQLTVVAQQLPSTALYTAYRVMMISGATVIAALLAAGVLAVLLINPISRRIAGLAVAAQSIAQGDTDVRADDAADDEFGALGGAFNTMVSALRGKVAEASAARQELAVLNEELEQRVQLRTAELEHANTDLERSKGITDSIIESLPGVFYQISPEGHFVRWNGAFERVTGYTPEEIAALSPLDLFGGEDKEAVGAAIAHVFEGGEAEVSADFVTKTGASTPYWFTGMLKHLDGAPYLIGMGTDVSALKEIEARLRHSKDALERSNKELEQFAYVASHDLQEPLRMVASYTQLLERRYKDQLDDTAREFIAFAVDGANRMQRLINDLLAYSRVQTRAGEPELVELSHVLGQARANLATAIEESGALVTNDGLPAVMADPAQLLSVLQNLIGNAVKFHGEEPPHVHVSARERDGEVEISVRDNGIGIRKEHQERIFLIFQRLHNRKEYPGTGIGLALCKRIVERHGGRIWVESEEGGGATFTFTLPTGRQKEQLT
jgi:PAS domain S-box-containing protein